MLFDPPYPDFVSDKVKEICQNIGIKGEDCYFPEIFMMLHEHVADNINLFLLEPSIDLQLDII